MTPAMRGIFAMIGAMTLFITNDMLLKLTVVDMPMGQALAIRSLIAVVILSAVIVQGGHGRAVVRALRPRVAMRSGFDAVTTLSYVLGLSVLPIATTTTIYMAAPLITTALAVPLLGESVSFKRWCAIFIGFSGAVIVTHPDPATFNLLVLLPLIAAFTGSLRDISTRGIPMDVPGPVVALSSAICLTLVGSSFSAWEAWVTPTPRLMFYLLASGLAFGIGNIMMVYAFRHTSVSVISPLRYILVPIALFYSYFIFSHVPDVWGIVGTVLVVGAGLYSIHREARRGREETRQRKAAAALVPSGAPITAAVTCSPPHS